MVADPDYVNPQDDSIWVTDTDTGLKVWKAGTYVYRADKISVPGLTEIIDLRHAKTHTSGRVKSTLHGAADELGYLVLEDEDHLAPSPP